MRGNPQQIEVEEVEGDYAMFQYGDQANQRFESKARNENTSTLGKTLATETDDKLAWCTSKGWFVTLNKEEHRRFREACKLKPPHTWDPNYTQRTSEETASIGERKFRNKQHLFKS